MLSRRKIAHPVGNGQHTRPDRPVGGDPCRLNLGDLDKLAR
jgi:hypothetical protein